MRKYILLLLLLVCFGCKRQHVYKTFYGTIDTDTMSAFTDLDGDTYYVVHRHYADSITADAMGLDSVCFVDFYNPTNNSYFVQVFGSDGGWSDRIYYDPYDKDSTLRKDFYGL